MNNYEREIDGLRAEITQLRRMQPPLLKIIGKRDGYSEVLNIIRKYLESDSGWVVEVDLCTRLPKEMRSRE